MDLLFSSNDIYQALKFLDQNILLLRLIISFFIVSIIFLGVFPLSMKETDEEKKAIEYFFIALRRINIIFFALVIPGFILCIFVFSNYVTGNYKYAQAFISDLFSFKDSVWTLYVGIILLSYTFKIIWYRSIKPNLSNFTRKHSVQQSAEQLSDVRKEVGLLKTKSFDPEKYFKDGYMFIGLDENDKPVYESDEDFKSRHYKIIGPSQVGKGVSQGVIIAQAILKGWTTGFFDVKPDDYIYSIMCKMCKKAGRPLPIVVDLNGKGKGSYAPFANGSKREILSRLQSALNINDTGTNADFYSANERIAIMDIINTFDGDLFKLMSNLNSDEDTAKMTQKSRAYLKEMMMHKPLNPKKGRGFNVRKTLDAKAVFYIRGSVSDPLVKKAQTLLLMEIVQTVLSGRKGETHFYLAVDELKFLVSDIVAAGLSTVLSKGMNMSVAFQSLDNLLNLDDKSLNASAIRSEVITNTLITLLYRAADTETADWGAKMSGTINKEVSRSEEVDRDKYGGEQYTGRKQNHKEQEYLLPENRLMNLPPMICGLYRPNSLAMTVFTSFVRLGEGEQIDIEPRQEGSVSKRQDSEVNRNYEYDDFKKEAGIAD